jgi:hypothetical protein
VETSALARALPASRGYRFAAIRFWRAGESVYGPDGTAEPAYRPDSSSEGLLRTLSAGLGGRSFEEGQTGAAASYLRELAGNGTTTRARGSARSSRPLAPYVALLGLLFLLASVMPSPEAARGLRLTRQ